MEQIYSLALAPILVGSSAFAQFTSLSLTSECDGGGGQFVQHFEPDRYSPRAAEARFTAAPTADESRLFSHCCFWRRRIQITGFPFEIVLPLQQFYNDPTDLTSQGGVTASFGNSHWTVTFPRVDGTDLHATWTQELQCRGADNQIVVNTWVLTNPPSPLLGLPIEIDFYAYADIDLADLETNATIEANASRQVLQPTPTTISGPFLEFHGAALDPMTNEFSVPPTTWEVDFFPNVERKLTSFGFQELSNSVKSVGSDDLTGAMGWRLTIPRGESRTIRYTFGRETFFCDDLGSVSHFPSVAAFPDTTLDVQGHPWPGVDLSIQLGGTPNTIASALMLGLDPLEAALPSCPMTHTLLVNPTILSGLAIPTDASGNGELLLPGSYNQTFFCGLPLHFQQWALTTSPSACPLLPGLEHSRRLTVTFGSM